MTGSVTALCIAPAAGDPMREVVEVRAIVGAGLEGDRYAIGKGSFNKNTGVGSRQVTLINAIFFENSGFTFCETRRNIVTSGVELNWLVGREFRIGKALLRGVKYCDPCQRPNRLLGLDISFRLAFFDRGGIVAEVIESGLIRVNDSIIPPPKSY